MRLIQHLLRIYNRRLKDANAVQRLQKDAFGKIEPIGKNGEVLRSLIRRHSLQPLEQRPAPVPPRRAVPSRGQPD